MRRFHDLCGFVICPRWKPLPVGSENATVRTDGLVEVFLVRIVRARMLSDVAIVVAALSVRIALRSAAPSRQQQEFFLYRTKVIQQGRGGGERGEVFGDLDFPKCWSAYIFCSSPQVSSFSLTMYRFGCYCVFFVFCLLLLIRFCPPANAWT